MVATGMIIEAQYVVQGESSRWGHEVLYSGERLSDRAPINIRTVGPEAPKQVRQQFSSIANILSRVDNEACLSTLATGQQLDGTLYLITLASDAGSLEALVGEGVPARELAEVGLQLFEGLAHLHAQGVILGYVAPSGVTLGERHTQPSLHIVDYSMARFETSSQQPPASIPAEWLAPEIRQGQRSSFAGDVYSAGLVLSSLAAANLPVGMASMIQGLMHEDPAQRPSASDAYAGFAAFVDASPVSFDMGWLPPRSSSQLSSGVFRLAEEIIAPEPSPTQVSVASVAASQPAPDPIVLTEAPRSRALGIGLAVAGLLAAGVVAFVVTASPSEPQSTAPATDDTPAAPASSASVAAPPTSPTPAKAADTAEVLEGNPIVWLSQVNRQDLGATLPYRDRHRLLDALASREGVYEKVNQRWNAMLDLWQAGDTDRPCATFAAALASLDEPASTDAERDLLGRVVVPVPAAGSHAGIGPDDSCEGLAEAFAELTAEDDRVATAQPRRKQKSSKKSKPLPRKPSPPSAPDSKPAKKKKKKSSVATKLDDDLRGI